MNKEKISLIKRKITSDMVGLDCFYPVYKSDMEYIKKCNYKKPILCSSKKSRNPQHHKLIFAIVKCILDNLPDGHTWNKQLPYDLLKAIMIEEFLLDLKLNIDGSLRPEPKHINFESMDENEFSQVSDAVFKWGSIMLGIEEDELRKNYMEYL